MNNKRGFTLLEIIIAFIVVAICCAIAMPNYFRQRERAVGGQALSTLSNIHTIEKIFSMENNAYTNVVADLTNLEPSLDVTDSNWIYTLTINGPADEFTATATRQNGRFVNYYIELESNGTVTYFDDSSTDIGQYPPP